MVQNRARHLLLFHRLELIYSHFHDKNLHKKFCTPSYCCNCVIEKIFQKMSFFHEWPLWFPWKFFCSKLYLLQIIVHQNYAILVWTVLGRIEFVIYAKTCDTYFKYFLYCVSHHLWTIVVNNASSVYEPTCCWFLKYIYFFERRQMSNKTNY